MQIPWSQRRLTGLTGLGGSGATPNYVPPSMIYKDVDEIYLPKGAYYKCGYRHRGQYQTIASAKWDIAALTAYEIDAAYSAGVSPGMLGGKVNSSWYSVFLLGATANDVIVLPFIRVDAISFGSGATTINPAAHNDGTTAENGFLTANDQWNGYRLVNLSDGVYDGNVYEISDCVDGTPDEIKVASDITAEVVATGWLQLIPPAGTDCLYLGAMRIDAAGNLESFKRDGWAYSVQVGSPLSLTGNCSATPADTDLGALIPPCASRIHLNFFLNSMTSAATAIKLYIYAPGETTFGNFRSYIGIGAGSTSYLTFNNIVPHIMNITGKLRNCMVYNSSSAIAAGNLRVPEWWE